MRLLFVLRNGLFGVCSVALLCACTVLRSEDLDAPGIIYYLPKTRIEVTVTPYGIKGYYYDKDKMPAAKPDADVNYVPFARPYEDEVYYVDFKFNSSMVADINKGYVLAYRRNPMTTDHVCATVNKGLLTSVDVATADETGNILISLAQLIGRTASSPFAITVQKDEKREIEALAHHSFSMPIDPLEPTQIAQLERRINERLGQLKFAARALAPPYSISMPDAQSLKAGGKMSECPADSVCYRTQVPLRAEVRTNRRRGHDDLVSVSEVDVVNQAITGHVNVTRAFMVEKVTKLGFVDGTLQSVSIRKPSEGLAVAKLPLAVVDAALTSLLAAPGKFLSNISGLPADQQLALIQKQAQINAEVQKLEQQWATMRNGDFLTGPIGRVATTSDKFSVTCAAPSSVSPKATP